MFKEDEKKMNEITRAHFICSRHGTMSVGVFGNSNENLMEMYD